MSAVEEAARVLCRRYTAKVDIEPSHTWGCVSRPRYGTSMPCDCGAQLDYEDFVEALGKLEAAVRNGDYQRRLEALEISVRRPREEEKPEVEGVEKQAPAPAACWWPATSPPEGPPRTWTRRVVGVTNLGKVCTVSYFHGQHSGDGVWQRPTGFEVGETVVWWTDKPEKLG